MRQDILSDQMDLRTVPETVRDDDDDVVVALETARVSEERHDLEATQRWLHRAAAAARRQGRPERAGVLTRFAARVFGQPSTFERDPDPIHVALEMDEEFAEETIVETPAEIARKSAELPLSEQEGSGAQCPFAHHALRVAVRKTLTGSFEARPLEPGESIAQGEQEALLVPTEGGAHL